MRNALRKTRAAAKVAALAGLWFCPCAAEERQDKVHRNQAKALAFQAMEKNLEKVGRTVASPEQMANAMEKEQVAHALRARSRSLLAGLYEGRVLSEHERLRKNNFLTFDAIPAEELRRLQDSAVKAKGGLKTIVQAAIKENFDPKFQMARSLAVRRQLESFSRGHGPTDEEVCALAAGTTERVQVDRAVGARCRIGDFFEENRDSIGRWVHGAVDAALADLESQRAFLGTLDPGPAYSMSRIQGEMERALLSRRRPAEFRRKAAIFPCLKAELLDLARRKEAERLATFLAGRLGRTADSLVNSEAILLTIETAPGLHADKAVSDEMFRAKYQGALDSLLIARYLALAGEDDPAFQARIEAAYSASHQEEARRHLQSSVENKTAQARREIAIQRYQAGYARALDTLVLEEETIGRLAALDEWKLREEAAGDALDTVKRREKAFLPELVGLVDSTLNSIYSLSWGAWHAQKELVSRLREDVRDDAEYATARALADTARMFAAYFSRVEKEWRGGAGHARFRKHQQIFGASRELIRTMLMDDLKKAAIAKPEEEMPPVAEARPSAQAGSTGDMGSGLGPGLGAGSGGGGGGSGGGGKGGAKKKKECPEATVIAMPSATVRAREHAPASSIPAAPSPQPAARPRTRAWLSFTVGALAGGTLVGMIVSTQ